MPKHNTRHLRNVKTGVHDVITHVLLRKNCLFKFYKIASIEAFHHEILMIYPIIDQNQY
jgi:hypothetical protein